MGRFRIQTNKKWCKNCGICAANCPKGVLKINEMKHLVVENADACIGCRMCEYRCPDMAITVEKLEVE